MKLIGCLMLLIVPGMMTTAYAQQLAQITTPVDAAQAYRSDAYEAVMIDLLDIKQMDVSDVLRLLSQKSGKNIVASQGVNGRVTIYLKDKEVMEVLEIIADAYGWALEEQSGVIKVITAQEYMQKYEHAYGRKLYTRIIELEHAETGDVEAVLEKLKSDQGKIVSDDKTGTLILVDYLAKLEEMEKIVGHMDVATETQTFQLSYVHADDIAKKIAEILTPALGTMRIDERLNRLIISDKPARIAEVKQLITYFDHRGKEVSVDAKIVQIVLNDEYKLGVDWQGFVRDQHDLTFVGDFDVLSPAEKSGRVSIGSMAADRYMATVEALETIGKTDILSSPSITTINNEEAKILVGSTEPYVTTTTTTPASGPSTIAESVNFIEVGVKLYVTPTIHEDDYITLKIKPEVSSVTSTLTTSNNNTIPIVETSEAETTVQVKNGITILIGGLIKNETINTDRQIPVFGDLPVLGQFFKSTNNQTVKTETVIFLTPRIVRGDENIDFDQRYQAVSLK